MAPWPQLAWNNRNTSNIDPGCTFPSGIVSPGGIYLHHRIITSTSQVPADIFGKFDNCKQANGNVRRRFHGTSCSARCNFVIDLKVSQHGTTHSFLRAKRISLPTQRLRPRQLAVLSDAGLKSNTSVYERYVRIPMPKCLGALEHSIVGLPVGIECT
ncbi:unnamed protein product [Ectocarpus sp. 12 AP-2014]